MKVSFKLNSTQLSIAQAIVSKVEAGSTDDERSVWCGNVLGEQWKTPCFNTDQDLELKGDILTYEGQRHPLLQDGAFDLLTEIAGGNALKLKVVSYETSDKRLAWHQTLSEYMWSQATWSEFKAYKGDLGIPSRFSDQASIYKSLQAGKSNAWLAAQFNSGLIRDVQVWAKTHI